MTRVRAACIAVAVAAAAILASTALARSVLVRLTHEGAPTYWRMLPDVDQAAGADESGYQSTLWGDAATGVFLAVGHVDVKDPDLRAVHRAMERALGDLGVEVNGFISDSEQPAQSLSRFAVRRGELAGQARLLTWGTDPGVVTARLAVCFHTPREPALAVRVCERVLQEYEHIPIPDTPQDPEESNR